MKKYILKNLKFLLSIILVFSIVFPLYASLTDTGYDSFLTKAEFEGALSDFNSRLSAFEAGVNAKIDTQVSSYLDRNGIWQKDEQVLIENKIKISGNAETGWKHFSGNWTIKPELAWPNRMICENLSKSGLAFIYFTIDAMHTSVAAGTQGCQMYTDVARTTSVGRVTANEYGRVLGRCKFKCWYSIQQKDSLGNYTGDTVYIWDPVQYKFSAQPGTGWDVTSNCVYTEAWGYKYQKSMVTMFVTKGNSMWTSFAYDYTAGQYSTSVYMGADVTWTTTCNSTTCNDAGTNNFWPIYNSIDSIAIY